MVRRRRMLLCVEDSAAILWLRFFFSILSIPQRTLHSGLLNLKSCVEIYGCKGNTALGKWTLNALVLS